MKGQAELCSGEVHRRVQEERVFIESLRKIVRKINKKLSDTAREKDVLR